MHVPILLRTAFATSGTDSVSAAIKDSNRTCGYPSIVNVSKIGEG